ncbi:SDR family oxidoreductase [Sphingomonas xinjiangensis]|uniref:NADP-dependent 3-hydroxy acid dehydrogenase YdfG n=1 Tax=Sphingomonas xinjiangensis TaxID=643568 RepID=A0A840YS17_9SPHN|nr:SDR family oxidoreductase [Sphingomonas xinjiangensis]MBB5712471.1 NADP-dependent 3-hydroxy acid dehydrogenase YdfG [Sphingomonas xinjiangensis]
MSDQKVAFITGASSGIGAGIARKLSQAGYAVAIAARRLDKLEALSDEIASAGGKALAVELDVTSEEANAAAVQKTLRELGRLDVVVANAGLMPLSDIDALKTDEWRRMIDVNVQGVLNTTAAALPTLMAQKSGHIVLMSSIAGRKVFKGLSVYCASKHAVAAFADGLRMEVAPKYNIRVTCVQPGAVASELYDHITDPNYRQQMDELAQQMTFLQPEDIGDAVAYAVQAPPHLDMAEMFVLPTQQGW